MQNVSRQKANPPWTFIQSKIQILLLLNGKENIIKILNYFLKKITKLEEEEMPMILI